MRTTPYESYSRIKSYCMFAMCVLSTLMILVILGLVTGYLAAKGYKSLAPSVFTQDPHLSQLDPQYPGGLRNGIVGTLILVGLASVVGIPLGMLAGIYLAEYSGNSRIAGLVRFTADV